MSTETPRGADEDLAAVVTVEGLHNPGFFAVGTLCNYYFNLTMQCNMRFALLQLLLYLESLAISFF